MESPTRDPAVTGRAFGGEVEGCRGAAGGVTPVDGALPVSVLVVVQHAVLVLARVPVLRVQTVLAWLTTCRCPSH